jgi:hypothetical protein
MESVFFLLGLIQCFSASLNKDNLIGLVDEMRALRTNRIWSKGRVEYTYLAENSVNLRSPA